jgi:hypothetical protein
MSEFIYLINQNGNPAKAPKELWQQIQAVQPNATEITEAEYNDLVGTPIDVEIITPEQETTTVEQENITTVEEVEEILNLDEYNKTVLAYAIQYIDPDTKLTVNDKKSTLITELQKFDNDEVKTAIDSYVEPVEPVTE